VQRRFWYQLQKCRVPLLPQGIDARGNIGAAWAFEMAEAAAGRACSRGPVTAFLQTAFGTVMAIVQVCGALQGAYPPMEACKPDVCLVTGAASSRLPPMVAMREHCRRWMLSPKAYQQLKDAVLQGGGALEHLTAAGGSSGGAVRQTPLSRRANEVLATIMVDSQLIVACYH
jgi:hypothetical protein